MKQRWSFSFLSECGEYLLMLEEITRMQVVAHNRPRVLEKGGMLTVESSQPFELQSVISNQRAKLNHTKKPACSQKTNNLVRSGWTVREVCSSVGPFDVGKGQEQESGAGRNHQWRLLESHSQDIQQLGRASGTTSQSWQTRQAHWPVLTFSPPCPCYWILAVQRDWQPTSWSVNTQKEQTHIM